VLAGCARHHNDLYPQAQIVPRAMLLEEEEISVELQLPVRIDEV
jgi:hypothetical protein